MQINRYTTSRLVHQSTVNTAFRFLLINSEDGGGFDVSVCCDKLPPNHLAHPATAWNNTSKLNWLQDRNMDIMLTRCRKKSSRDRWFGFDELKYTAKMTDGQWTIFTLTFDQ